MSWRDEMPKKTPYPKSEQGQHFLENEQTLRFIADQVPAGARVVEIGAGAGQLTKWLARRAKEIDAIESDPRFKKDLEKIRRTHPGVHVIIDNALKVDLKEYQGAWVAGNIPYHITEPLISKLVRADLAGIVLLVGDSFAQEAMALSGGDLARFGKLSLTVHAFYRPAVIRKVGKKEFSPVPRTESYVLTLIPLEKNAYQNPELFLLRRLLLVPTNNPLVKNALMNGLIAYKDQARHRVQLSEDTPAKPTMTKNEARAIISQLGLTREILEVNFEQLNNDQYLALYRALQKVSV